MNLPYILQITTVLKKKRWVELKIKTNTFPGELNVNRIKSIQFISLSEKHLNDTRNTKTCKLVSDTILCFVWHKEEKRYLEQRTYTPVQYGFNIISFSRILSIKQLDPHTYECLIHVLLRHFTVHFSTYDKSEKKFIYDL